MVAGVMPGRRAPLGELRVRGGGRVNDQALHVGDIGQQTEHLQMVNELPRGVLAAP